MAQDSVSASDPDWSREAVTGVWDPGRKLLRAHRRHARARNRLARMRWSLAHRFWSVVTQCDIPLGTCIGGGLLLPHPNGIVIHPSAVIGPNCLIFQQVTVGLTQGSTTAPVIGGHVDIGAGAKVLGPVRVGEHVLIGANAVVARDVPAGCVARGVPARVFPGSGADGAV